MAVFNGTFLGASRPHTLRLTVTEVSQNIEANTTVVSWVLQAIKDPAWSSYSFSSSNSWSVTIDGVTSSGSWTYDFRTTSVVAIASGTRTIAHNADGTKTISVSATAYGTSIGTANCSGSMALTTIPRASVPSFSAATVDAGTSVTINTNRASASFTHTVRYSFGADSGTIATGVGVSTPWVPPLSLLNQIPNSTTGTITIFLDTFSGATLIGTRSATFTLRAANDIVPTIGSVTATEAVALVASEVGAFVRTLSRLNLAIVGAAGAYGSTIVPALSGITVDGQAVTGLSGTTGPLANAGSFDVVATVVDSRGRSASQTISVTVLAYAAPTIAATTTVRRSDNTGVLDEQGTYLRIDLEAAVQSLLVSSVQKNTLTYRISARLRGDTAWTVKTTVVAPGVTFDDFVLISSYAVESSWEVLIEVYDKFNAAMLQNTIATATVFMHWGEGLGLGKFWEAGRGTVDAAGQMYQNDGQPVIDASDVATEAAAGIIEIASDAEIDSGVDDTRAVTPEKLVRGLARSGGMRYVDTVYFTSSGTFSKASYPWLRGIRVLAQGAGGAGGGAAAPGASNHNAGSGGGGGGCTEAFITDIAGLPTNVTVTVGAGGTAASGAAGNAGGDSSFNSTIIGAGGGGGLTTAASALATSATPGAGGEGSGGDVTYAGTAGGMAGGNATLGIGGSGGGAHLGGGAVGAYTGAGSGGVTGATGKNYGGGGGGGTANASATARSGGAGAPGIVIVELYA